MNWNKHLPFRELLSRLGLAEAGGGKHGLRSGLLGLLGLALVLAAVPVKADTRYINESTGFTAAVQDDADLLTDEEETLLVEQMQPITQYGHVGFRTSSYMVSSESCYRELCGSASGTIFLIDMDRRMIEIYSDGAVYKVITRGRADTITDNVYRYASRGEYYRCAAEAYGQIFTLLQGDEIAQPMKYISNGLLALLLSLLINFIWVLWSSRQKEAPINAIVESASVAMNYSKPRSTFLRKSQRYSPLPKSGGGGRGGGGGRSGGGGGHSGGGGGHRF